jgi:hypothetical protein
MGSRFCLRIAERSVRFSGARPLLRTINGTFGDQKSGVNQGPFRQYGLALDLGWKPRRRWSTGVSYSLTRREGTSTISSSTTTSTSYLENLVTFKLVYLF